MRSISTGWPWRSYRASTKWKKLDFLRLDGGCFSKWARANPTPLKSKEMDRNIKDAGGRGQVYCCSRHRASCAVISAGWQFLQRFSVTVKYFTSGSCAEKQRITVKCTKCFKSRKTSWRWTRSELRLGLAEEKRRSDVINRSFTRSSGRETHHTFTVSKSGRWTRAQPQHRHTSVWPITHYTAVIIQQRVIRAVVKFVFNLNKHVWVDFKKLLTGENIQKLFLVSRREGDWGKTSSALKKKNSHFMSLIIINQLKRFC